MRSEYCISRPTSVQCNNILFACIYHRVLTSFCRCHINSNGSTAYGIETKNYYFCDCSSNAERRRKKKTLLYYNCYLLFAVESAPTVVSGSNHIRDCTLISAIAFKRFPFHRCCHRCHKKFTYSTVSQPLKATSPLLHVVVTVRVYDMMYI